MQVISNDRGRRLVLELTEARSLELSASGEQETRGSSFFGGIKSPSGAPEVMAGLATPRVCTARLSPSVTGTCQ